MQKINILTILNFNIRFYKTLNFYFITIIFLTIAESVHTQPIQDNKIIKNDTVLPQFPGGEIAFRRFIAANVQYPMKARESSISGKVYVRFAITKDGDVVKVSIAESVHPIIDNEAIRVVKLSPKWKPGELNGEKVNVWYTVPINFGLDAPMNKANNKLINKQVKTNSTKSPKYTRGYKELQQFLDNKIKYPRKIEKKIKGRVYVKFLVNINGTINELTVVRSLHPLLDKEALRVVKLTSGDWIPGKKEGKNVQAWYTVAVEF